MDTNPLRIFDCKVESCRELARVVPQDHRLSVRRMPDISPASAARSISTGSPTRLDDSLVRGLDYYTKTTFEIVNTSAGQQNAILGGAAATTT